MKLKSNIRIFSTGCVGVCSVSAADKQHPNKLPFTGTLLLLDTPSDKPPHGSHGHRILVTKAAAEKHLPSLIGQGINYDPGDLNEHMPRHKVGVVNGYRIQGNKVVVYGDIWKKDFPEAEKQLKGRKDLGMSMELGDVFVKDDQADVWDLQGFQFTGGTILKKNAAAYTDTALAASAAAKGKGATMPKEKEQKKKKIAAAAEGVDSDQLAAVITSAVQAGNAKLERHLQSQDLRITAMAGRIDELNGAVTVLASAGAMDDDEDDEDIDIAAAKHEDDEDAAKHEDDEDAATDDGEDDEDDDEDDGDGKKKDGEDDEELDAMEDLEEGSHNKPGEVNKNMKKKGNKTTTTDVGAVATKGGLVKAVGMHAAAIQITTMRAAFDRKLKTIKAVYDRKMAKQGRKLERIMAQVERYTELEDRRSAVTVPPDITNLLAKSNIDVREIQASGQKLSVANVDAIFAGVDADPTQRMAWKNRMLELGLMDQGEMKQQYGLQ